MHTTGNRLRRQISRLVIQKAGHIAVTILLFWVFWLMFRYFHTETKLPDREFRYNYFIWLAYAIIYVFLSRTYNAYLLGFSRIRTLVVSQTVSQLLAVLLIYIGVTIAWSKVRSPVWLLALLPVQLIWNCFWSYHANNTYIKICPPKKTIFVYRDNKDKAHFGNITGKPLERLYTISKEVRYTGKTFTELQPELEGYEAVFVAGVDSKCRNGIVKYCAENNIPGFFLPHVGDVLMRGAKHIQSFSSPVLYQNRKRINPEYRIIKRAFDISASLLGIIILSPIMLIIACAVRIEDHGPILYKQLRLTQNGRQFQIMKFRSMRVNAEKDGGPQLSTGSNDDRVTKVGQLIRKCRMDELPQLFNILKGEMTFVGPRPERPEIAQQYSKVYPDFNLRLQVKAGLTGYAQVYGKYNTDPYEKMEFDLMYINDMSIITDLQLLFATLIVLFSGESTMGVNATQKTALNFKTERQENKDH